VAFLARLQFVCVRLRSSGGRSFSDPAKGGYWLL